MDDDAKEDEPVHYWNHKPDQPVFFGRLGLSREREKVPGVFDVKDRTWMNSSAPSYYVHSRITNLCLSDQNNLNT